MVYFILTALTKTYNHTDCHLLILYSYYGIFISIDLYIIYLDLHIDI